MPEEEAVEVRRIMFYFDDSCFNLSVIKGSSGS